MMRLCEIIGTLKYERDNPNKQMRREWFEERLLVDKREIFAVGVFEA
jgi:hypothetical protein